MSAVIPKISQLSKSVIRILGCNPGHMTLQGTNTYLIGTGYRRILLDTGEPDKKDYLELLKKVLVENKVKLSDIVVTHWHGDHVGGVKDILESIAQECNVWKYVLPNERSAPEKFKHLSDGDEIKTEGATLKFYHTPGHTQDHLVALLLEESVLFSGDCILGEGTAVFEDLRQYMSSLHVILDLNPSVIFPGHGPVVQSPSDKIREYIDHRNERESAILATLPSEAKDALSAQDIVKIIYTEVPEILHPAAAVNVRHHLEKLQHEAKILRQVDGNDTERFYLAANNAS